MQGRAPRGPGQQPPPAPQLHPSPRRGLLHGAPEEHGAGPPAGLLPRPERTSSEPPTGRLLRPPAPKQLRSSSSSFPLPLLGASHVPGCEDTGPPAPGGRPGPCWRGGRGVSAGVGCGSRSAPARSLAQTWARSVCGGWAVPGLGRHVRQPGAEEVWRQGPGAGHTRSGRRAPGGGVPRRLSGAGAFRAQGLCGAQGGADQAVGVARGHCEGHQDSEQPRPLTLSRRPTGEWPGQSQGPPGRLARPGPRREGAGSGV